ncbi:hypothetical protein HDU85_002276 [Gaertneriomyces sp. JEL0708]|nr:hypothetical protein HDU85_002276 [Gaertneriomyces sp. JEL0708]
MTSQLPPNLQKLFIPRPPLKYLPPVDKDHVDRKGPRLSGLAEFLERCQGHDLDYVPTPTLAEVRKRKKEEREKRAKQAIEEGTTQWDPNSDEHIHSDPYKTLFIGRLSYESTEKDLLKAFEAFGPIKTLRIVTTPEGKSRGYAFIEYEREKDMKAAYKEADGMKINDRRVLVDVERGRTVKGWKPRRLGGGLGVGVRVLTVRQWVDPGVLMIEEDTEEASEEDTGVLHEAGTEVHLAEEDLGAVTEVVAAEVVTVVVDLEIGRRTAWIADEEGMSVTVVAEDTIAVETEAGRIGIETMIAHGESTTATAGIASNVKSPTTAVDRTAIEIVRKTVDGEAVKIATEVAAEAAAGWYHACVSAMFNSSNILPSDVIEWCGRVDLCIDDDGILIRYFFGRRSRALR